MIFLTNCQEKGVINKKLRSPRDFFKNKTNMDPIFPTSPCVEEKVELLINDYF